MFQQDQHNRILAILTALNSELFHKAQCALAGPAAVTLRLGEYRVERDIEIFCGAQHGERLLRDIAWQEGVAGWFRQGAMPPISRDLKCGMHGMQVVLDVAGGDVTLQITPERKFALHAHSDNRFKFPVLDDTQQYVSRLLDNAVRWDDGASHSCDIIDLAMMVSRIGPVPDDAWRMAESAYGEQVVDAFRSAAAFVENQEWLKTCLTNLAMSPSFGAEIREALGRQVKQIPCLCP